MRIPGLKLFRSIFNLFFVIFWRIVRLVSVFLSPIIDFVESLYLFFRKYFLFLKGKILGYFLFRKDLKARYKEIRIKNIEDSIQKCIEGVGGEKNILKVESTINTLRIWVNFKNFIDDKKIKECSAAGVNISGNLIEIIAGFNEAKKICKKLNLSVKKNKNLSYKFSEKEV